MVLSTAQLQLIQAHILASPDLNTIPSDDDGDFEIARLLNLPAAPAFWAWRTNVLTTEIYNTTSDLAPATDWDWTAYKQQAVGEQGAWREMFFNFRADFSKANLRAGIGKIHGDASNNTKHSLAIGRRTVTRCEKVLATGTGTTASPGVMTAEGAIAGSQVDQARNL